MVDLGSGEIFQFDFAHVPDKDNPETALWLSDIVSLNEARTKLGMAPQPGGDVVFHRHIEMAAKFVADKIEEAGLPVPTCVPVPLAVAVEMARRLSEVKVLDDRPLGFYTGRNDKSAGGS